MNKRISVLLLVAVTTLGFLIFWQMRLPGNNESVVASVPVEASAVVATTEQDDESDDEDPDATEQTAQNLILFFGNDDRVFVSPPYAGAFSAIGKMQTVGESLCTATLIAPDLAVTAAHCFLMTPKKLDKGRWFWAGYHQGKWLARYKIEDQIFHPRFRKGLEYKGDDVYIKPQAAPYDIALLKLKLIDGTSPKPMPVFSGNADALLEKIQRYNSEVTQAGFAHDHSQVLTAHQRCQVTSLVEDNTLEHQCDTLSGDSGSPLWLVTENGPELVAVQSSAPDWFNRDKADNTAVTVLQLPKRRSK